MKLTPFAKFLLIVAIVVGGIFGLRAIMGGDFSKIIPAAKGQSVSREDLGVPKTTPIVRVCVVTWGGYAGGEYFNRGFKANKNSEYYKKYGMLVDFVVMDDYAASREAWKAGKVDLLWTTADSFPVEAANLATYSPKIVFQSDWSRGGDAIVVRQGINSVKDLVGKKIAVAYATPSHTFLLWMLEAGDIAYNDVTIVEAPSAIDAAEYFKGGKVDAAVCWSPDDEACVKAVAGSKVLKNTRQASKIIADVFYAKEAWLAKNRDVVAKLVEGWLIGAAEINTVQEAKVEAVRILAAGLNQPVDFCALAINNVRLSTYGDNMQFFNVTGNYAGVKGEDIYSKMSSKYTAINLITGKVPAWRTVIDVSFLRDITLEGAMHNPEENATFTPVTAEVKTATAFSSKALRVSFSTGSSTLTEDAKYIIQIGFVDVAKSFANARIRIEGNTDSVGGREDNVYLSQLRAQAVADYLANTYGFDRNRFVIIGNGPDKPIADNSSSEGKAKNRRTDFQLLN